MSRPDAGPARRAARSLVRGAGMATASARPLPDVLIIGAKRGGTTSLYRALELNPQFLALFPPARFLPMRENMKGVHYFDGAGTRSERWYRSHFATHLARWITERRRGAVASGEASPYYLFHPLAARRAAATVPHARIVALLRDPVERTISHWSEQRRNGVETLSLADALRAERDRVGDDAAGLAEGALAHSHAHEHQSYLAQSDYEPGLRRWLEAFGTDRVMVRFSEDFYRDPSTVLADVERFIGLKPYPRTTMHHRNAAPRDADDTECIDWLTDQLAGSVHRLRELLGIDPPWPRFRGR